MRAKCVLFTLLFYGLVVTRLALILLAIRYHSNHSGEYGESVFWIFVSSCHYLPPFYHGPASTPMIGLSAWGFCWSSCEVLDFPLQGCLWVDQTLFHLSSLHSSLHVILGWGRSHFVQVLALLPSPSTFPPPGALISSLLCFKSVLHHCWKCVVPISCLLMHRFPIISGPKIALTSLMGWLELVLFGKVSKIRLQCSWCGLGQSLRCKNPL